MTNPTNTNTSNKSAADNISENIVHFDKKELKKMAHNTGESIRHFITEKNQQAGELRVKGEEAVKSHPYKAIAAATVGGLILGALLRRK